MGQAFQFTSLPMAIILWLFLYSCDYFLTLHGKQLHMKYATAHIGIDGSYELNPFYQRDIDADKRVSRRFIFMLILFAVWLVALWYAAQLINIPEIFSIAAGYVLLLEVPILGGHLQNISLYNFMKTPGSVVGFITYARWIEFTLSAHKFGYWLLVYVALFFITGNWIFVGGILSMLRLYVSFNGRGEQSRKKSPTVTPLKNETLPMTQTVVDPKIV